MDMTLKYSSQFAGARAVAKNGAQGRIGFYNVGTFYSYSAGDYAYCTGYYYEDGWILYVQTTVGLYLIVNLNNPDWSFTENAIKPKTYTQTQAQALVNQIIANNQAILCNNLLCARYANKLTEEQRNAVRSLQSRLIERSNALQTEGLTDKVHTSYPGGYAELSPYLDKLMSGEAVGIATWVVIVIAATVIAGMGTAAYFAYKSLAEESEKDVKYSKELTKVLTSKLTEEEYQQLLNETKGIVTKARIKQAVGSYWDVLKWAAIGFAGYTIYRTIKNRYA